MKPYTERVAIRDATINDMCDLIAIERDACGHDAWPADIMAAWLGVANTAALVAETTGDGVIGFAIHRLDPGGVMLMDLCVDRGYQRRGIASDLIAHLAGRFPREPIACYSRRHLTHLHACLRANGFRVKSVMRPEDCFLHWLDAVPRQDRGASAITPTPARPRSTEVPR